MKERKAYETPEMEVVTFEKEDIITDSSDLETPIVPIADNGMDDDFYYL